MIRTEESKRLWNLAQIAQDWETMDKIEREWEAMEYADEIYYDNRSDWDSSIDDMDYAEFAVQYDDSDWTDEDEARLEEWEEERRVKLAEANEY